MTKKTPKTPHARMTFCLPQEMKTWLADHSEETGLSEAEILRRAIDLYRNQLRRKAGHWGVEDNSEMPGRG